MQALNFHRVFIDSIMKKTFLFCLFFTVFFTHAQEKYSDIQIGTKYTLIQLKEAVNKASWCGYYHSEFEFELTFDDGAIVNLKSKSQLLQSGHELSESCFQSNLFESNDIFVIAENGNLFVPKSTQYFKPKN